MMHWYRVIRHNRRLYSFPVGRMADSTLSGGSHTCLTVNVFAQTEMFRLGNTMKHCGRDETDPSASDFVNNPS